jgi:hypothetical protein
LADVNGRLILMCPSPVAASRSPAKSRGSRIVIIWHSAFVLAEVTDGSPNVYYEIGYAQGLGKHVILTAMKGTQLPFDISDVPVILWDDQNDLMAQLRHLIKAVVARVHGTAAAQ